VNPVSAERAIPGESSLAVPGQRYVARQPILDRTQKVFGYELLFRDGVENCFRADPETASRSTLDSTLLFGLRPLCDGSRAFVAGTSRRVQGAEDYTTVAYNMATGDRLWVANYDGPVHSYDDLRAVKVSPDGAHVYVTGRSVGVLPSTSESIAWEFATIAYDAVTGAQEWVARLNGNSIDPNPPPVGQAASAQATALEVAAGHDAIVHVRSARGDALVAARRITSAGRADQSS